MLKEECHKDKFKFNHEHPEVFTRCFWYKHPRIVVSWIAYRLFLVVYFFFVLLSLVFFRPEKGYVWYKNMLYISSISCFFELVLFGVCFVITVARFMKEKKNPELPPLEKMPCHYKFMWFWYNFTASNEIVVTIMFWLLVYNPDVDTNVMFLIAGKFFNSVFLIIDYLLCDIPFRLLHVYVPCIYPAFYITFSAVYQFSGGTGNAGMASLYKILDWKKPQAHKPVLFLIMYLTLLVFSHCGMCTLYFLKVWMRKREEEYQYTNTSEE